jgi:nitrate/nitrite transport system ATP-binding protein
MDTLVAPPSGRLIQTQEDFVKVDNIGVTFHTKRGPFVALRDVSLQVKKGEFVTLIGHSGCGKSTLLNLVAGLNLPSAGTVICAGREVSGPGPDRGMVFQNHSLLPWLSAFDNVHLAVERVFGGHENKAQLKARTHSALDLVNLTSAAQKYPHEISGGMKQRVGIARALAMEPQVLLLDEPFGALDALTRAGLQDELMKIVAKTHSTVMMVTHDVDEAVLLADRIVMMTNGPAATIGKIVEIELEKPRDRVALSENTAYHHYRREVLEFLYAKHERKVA